MFINPSQGSSGTNQTADVDFQGRTSSVVNDARNERNETAASNSLRLGAGSVFLVAGGAEPGHGAPPASDPAYAAALSRWDQAMVRFDAALDAHHGANTRNAEIDRANAPKQKQVDLYTRLDAAILKVTSHAKAGDSYLSRQEVLDLLQSSDPQQIDAAQLILDHWHTIPAPKHADWGGGMNTNEMRQAASVLRQRATALRDSMDQRVTVPPHPGEAPPMPPPPGSTQSASTGTTTTPTTPVPAKEPQAETASTTETVKPQPKPEPTPEEFRAKALTNSNKVPAFSSSAISAEGRMQDGVKYCQNKLDALQDDLVAAAAKGDQGAIALINSEISKFQAGLSALMQMLKQRQESESNMAKMFNEMSMSAIRNMR